MKCEEEMVGKKAAILLKKSTVEGYNRINHQLPIGSTLILDLTVKKKLFGGENVMIVEIVDRTEEMKLQSWERRLFRS